MRRHCIGDLVVAGLDEPVSKTSAAIGIVVDKVLDCTNGYDDDDLLLVMWPDGIVRSRWSGDVVALED